MTLRGAMRLSLKEEVLLRQVMPRWMHIMSATNSWQDIFEKKCVFGKDVQFEDTCTNMVAEITGFEQPGYRHKENQGILSKYNHEVMRIGNILKRLEIQFKQNETIQSEHSFEQTTASFSRVLKEIINEIERDYPEIIERSRKEYEKEIEESMAEVLEFGRLGKSVERGASEVLEFGHLLETRVM